MENFYLTKRNVMRLSNDTFVVVFDEKLSFKPGQFLMVYTGGLVRKPFLLGTWQGQLAISVKVKGERTRKLVNVLERIKAHGPLGKEFIPPSENGLVIGSPSALTFLEAAADKWGCDVAVASREKVALQVPFKTLIGDEEFLRFLKGMREKREWFLLVGSRDMKKTAVEILGRNKVFASLEEFMGCGIGACKGCAVFVNGEVKHVCKDGPIFEVSALGGDVI